MKLLRITQIWKFFSRSALAATIFVISTLANARAAELVMFEQAGCAWCETFDREIAPIYPKTEEGQRAPLRRVNIDHPLPPDLAFLDVERLAPLLVLVDKGQEIGRIRGYPGEEHFWGLLGVLMKKLDSVRTGCRTSTAARKSVARSRLIVCIQPTPKIRLLVYLWNCITWKPALVQTNSTAWSTMPNARAIF